MSILLPTTTIEVLNPATGSMFAEPYEGLTYTTVASAVPAVIDTPTSGAHGGREQNLGGEQTISVFRLFCDLCPLQRLSLVVDSGNPTVRYRVLWLQRYENDDGGMSHIQGEIEVVEGLA